MLEIKPVSPLLDGMSVRECFSHQGGTACYDVIHRTSGKRFVLKVIQVPASETKTQALILAGAVSDEAGAQAYYKEVANDIRDEAEQLQSLSGHSCVAAWTGCQIEPRKDGIGFDVYLLMPRYNTLKSFLQKNALSQLQALNLGIDLCNALGIMREAGYVYLNLKPENILVDAHDHYMIGDLGMMPLNGLSYCAVPEDYLSDFSAPELMQLFAEPNATSDLYSLGMILYYIFNGNHLPFDDGKLKPEKIRQMRLQGEPLPAPAYADYELTEIIAKACNPDPDWRYSSPAEMRQELVLYMRRNNVSDQLLVPPLSTEEAPAVTSVKPDDAAVLLEMPSEERLPVAGFAEPAVFPEELPLDEAPMGQMPEEESPVMEMPEEELSALLSEEPEEEPTLRALAEPAEETVEVYEGAPAEDSEEATFTVYEEAPTAAFEGASAAASEKAPAAAPEEATPFASYEQALQEVFAEEASAQAAEEAPQQKASPAPWQEDDDSELSRFLRSFDEDPEDAFAGSDENLPEDGLEAELEDDMSLEDLLATVNDVLEEDPQEVVADAPDFEANEAAQKEEQQKKNQKKPWVPILVVLLILGILSAAIAYFYTNWYLVTMEELNVTERSDTSITVSYSLSTPDPGLSWECIDTYGNSFPGISGENMVTFTDLSPGMQYTITFQPGKLHELLGATTISAATATQTQIVSLTAVPGGSSTTAEVSMVVSGPEPEKWVLIYSSSGNDSGSVTFSGHSVVIPELDLHDKYTFELHAPNGIYLAGQTSCTLDMTANVQARDLKVTAATENSLTVTWESLADTPQNWSVNCLGEGYDQTLVVTECAATFIGTSLNTSYTFIVSAPGLNTPLSVSLPANATLITSMEADALDAGRVEVAWSSAGPVPEGGWLVRYYVGGDEALGGSVLTEGSSATLSGLPPKSEIVVSLAAANGSAVIGAQSLTVLTPEAPTFAAHSFASAESSLKLYALPNQEGWGYDDLGDAAEAYDPGAPLAVVLQAPAGFSLSDEDETPITLVLRTESGKVADYDAVSCTWDDIWRDGRYLTSLKLPETPGSYQVELYFNYQYVNSCLVTVNGGEPTKEPKQ